MLAEEEVDHPAVMVHFMFDHLHNNFGARLTIFERALQVDGIEQHAPHTQGYFMLQVDALVSTIVTPV